MRRLGQGLLGSVCDPSPITTFCCESTSHVLPARPAKNISMSKTKTIHFFRHAQAEHNIWSEHDFVGPEVRDTSLTPHGIEQAKEILTTAAVTNFKQPTLLISSPLRRCLQTALYAFHPDFNESLQATLEKNKEFPRGSISRNAIQKLFKKGNIKFESDPRIMECLSGKDSWAHYPTPVEELPPEIRALFTFPEDLFPSGPDAEWLNREGMYKDYSLRRLATGRVNRFFRYLYTRPEEEIIVVAHEDLLRHYLLPIPWEQPIPNACGFSFTIKWEVTSSKVQRKKMKEIELEMSMEEIIPRPVKLRLKSEKNVKTDKYVNNRKEN